jgi:hypothetical protein
MVTTTVTEERTITSATRRKPIEICSREFPAHGDGSHGPDTGPRPTDLRLEVTLDDGTISPWFDDGWWIETLRRWKDRPLSIHILPTPEALLHPKVAVELDMVRRMQTPWRLVGHCYLSDVAHPTLLTRLAVNRYDDIRIVDASRPRANDWEVSPPQFSLAEVFERVRAIQLTEQVVYPLLTRAPDPHRARA